MRTLWLVRHATPLVEPGTCYGSLDLAADAADTEAAAGTLIGTLPPHAALVSSPLQRCRQLASALVRRRAEKSVRLDPRLAEMHFGTWEGRPWHAIGATALDAWTADFAHHAPGGGETAQGFIERVVAAMGDLPRGDTVWVTHAGVIRAAGLIASGRHRITSAADWPRQTIAFGSCLRLPLPKWDHPA